MANVRLLFMSLSQVAAFGLLAACGGDSELSDGGTSSDLSAAADGGATVDLSKSSAPDASRAEQTVLIAGGQDLRHVVSFDGMTFGHDTYVAANGLDNAFGLILVGNHIVVAAGDAGIYTTTDALTWTSRGKPVGVASMHGVTGTFANGRFVLVAKESTLSSTDGITWTVTNDLATSSEHWHGMAYGNGHWVAIGDNLRKVSDDGATWHDFAPTPVNLNAIAFGNGVFVATASGDTDAGAGSVGYTITSTNGVTWTAPVYTLTSYGTGLAGIAYGQGKFVTGDCCNVFTSTDGSAWTKKGTGFGGGGIVFSGVGFVAVSWRTNISVSTDGESFTHAWSDDGPNLFDAAAQAPWLTSVGAGVLYP